MNIGVYKSAAALVACERWQDVISQNIASSSSPGFKKTEATFESMVADTERFGRDARASKEMRGEMPSAVSQISFQPGQIHLTGSETDFAVKGKGFFQVQRPAGGPGYTRNGEFHLNPERVLVNKDGFPVLGDGGPISFKAGGGAISISDDGTLAQGETIVGKLPIYDFADPAKLRRAGDGLLEPSDARVTPEAVEKPEIVGSALENSNVAPVQEMVNLITISRAYEANQRVLMAHDESVEKAIQSLNA